MGLKRLMLAALLVAVGTSIARDRVTTFDTDRRGYGIPGYYAEVDLVAVRVVYLALAGRGRSVEVQTGTSTYVLWRGS